MYPYTAERRDVLRMVYTSLTPKRFPKAWNISWKQSPINKFLINPQGYIRKYIPRLLWILTSLKSILTWWCWDNVEIQYFTHWPILVRWYAHKTWPTNEHSNSRSRIVLQFPFFKIGFEPTNRRPQHWQILVPFFPMLVQNWLQQNLPMHGKPNQFAETGELGRGVWGKQFHAAQMGKCQSQLKRAGISSATNYHGYCYLNQEVVVNWSFS